MKRNLILTVWLTRHDHCLLLDLARCSRLQSMSCTLSRTQVKSSEPNLKYERPATSGERPRTIKKSLCISHGTFVTAGDIYMLSAYKNNNQST
jgi:hypothetical protein